MKYVLRLYVTGQTSQSAQTLNNIKKACEEELKDEYDLKIIDILKEPQRALEDNVIATPTLVKKLPPPLRKLIGHLSETDHVLSGLNLKKAS